MSSRLPIALGLLLGGIAALGLIAGATFVLPDAGVPTHRPSASLSPFQPRATPTVTGSLPPTGSPGPSGSAATSGSPAPSGSPGASVPTGSASAIFHVGEIAPALSVPQVGGGTIDLSTLRGKPVWVNFMATTCPSCRDEFPLMNGFAARYAANGLVIVAVDVREDEGSVAAFAQSLNTAFPVGLDRDGAAQKAWGAYALPVHYWIDAQGIVRDGSLGGIGPDLMAKGLESIMPGVHVAP